jgi:hypothetical protein
VSVTPLLMLAFNSRFIFTRCVAGLAADQPALIH